MKKVNNNFLLGVKHLLPENKEDTYLIYGILALTVCQFLAFKYFFLYANYIHGDSFVYISMAAANSSVGTYPIGYPMFLRLFSVFSRSDLFLVAFQYFLLIGSLLYFVFTIFKFYNLSIVTKIAMVLLVICNPLYLFIANYVSTDALFLALSIIWFTQILWLMRGDPSIYRIILNSLLLFILFIIRYNALFYPVIVLISILLHRRYLVKRLLGLFLSCILIFIYVGITSRNFERISGIYQFTPFSGWQLANNALYAYRYVDSAHVKKLPEKFNEIDHMVRSYYDTTKDIKKFPAETLKASTVYMWAPNSPLTLYAERKSDKRLFPDELVRWAKAAPMMKDYGIELIKTYPKEFLIYYILPNSMKYYAPPIEFLGEYNDGIDSVNRSAMVWFGYKDLVVHNRIKNPDLSFLSVYSVIYAGMNVMVILEVIFYFLFSIYKRFSTSIYFIGLTILVWIINMFFSVFASSIALRFQMFPIILELSMVITITGYLIKIAFERKPEINEVFLLEPDINK